jgi:hypothetical protein
LIAFLKQGVEKGFSHPASLSVISPGGGELKESSPFFAQGVESQELSEFHNLPFSTPCYAAR